MGYGGWKARHTEEEVVWAKNTIQNKLNNDVKAKKILQLNILNEYTNKFNKKISITGIYTWLRSIQNPELKKRSYVKKEAKLVFGAKYLLYVNAETICGFETTDEVKEFLETNIVLSGQKLCLYEKKELDIKYAIEIK
jgi:hypothetical protein